MINGILVNIYIVVIHYESQSYENTHKYTYTYKHT